MTTERVGFFTDTSVCIGCKACEVACKEWNDVPEDGLDFTGHSYDNTGALGAEHLAPRRLRRAGPRRRGCAGSCPPTCASTAPRPRAWRCARPARSSAPSSAPSSCSRTSATAAATASRPARTASSTGARRTGARYKCTLCYDRLKDDMTPACAKACPTESIQFGPLDEMRERAFERLEVLQVAGESSARLYGEDPGDGVGGQGSIFLLLDEPEVYGLPPDPVVDHARPRLDVARGGGRGRGAAGRDRRARASGAAVAPATDDRDSYYGRPILKAPVWTWEIPAYFFFGGMAGAAAPFALAQRAARRPRAGAAGVAGRAGRHRGEPAAADRRPRPPRALPPHAARAQADLADERRLLGPRRQQHARSRSRRAQPASAGSRALGARGGRDRGRSGPALSTYTAVLVADTAIPAWHEARRELPFVFAAGAAMSAGVGDRAHRRRRRRRGGWRSSARRASWPRRP